MPRVHSPYVLVAVAAVVTAVACSGGTGGRSVDDGPTPADLAAQGGDATVENEGSMAFAQPVPGLSGEQDRTFAVGNNFFNDNWVTAPSSTAARDGLGPLFNAQSCSSCHFHDGRARPPSDPDDPERGLLLRLSVPASGGSGSGSGDPGPHPTLGDQLQDRAIRGIPPEGEIEITTVERTGRFGDGTRYTLAEPRYEIVGPDGSRLPGTEDVQVSPRIAPAIFGVGLLENVPEDAVLAREDPDDEDGDGISGRANRVADPSGDGTVLGRFGWKAGVPTVEDQNARALQGDIGITSTLRPDQPCTRSEASCRAAPAGGDPEIEDERLDQITFYTRTLAVPARREVGATSTTRGQDLFDEVGCASCHVAELRTGPSDIEALDEQVIRPYTDLLLHDMGPGLADDRPDGEATGREWRTAPLWGIGLVETVNDHTRFLHDGRARDLTEAVLWHGGEAADARRRFAELPAADREAVIAFLESL